MTVNKTNNMKKNTLFILVITSLTFLSFKTNPTDDTNSCIVKVNSEWGSVCEKCVEYRNNQRVYDDTYKAYLKNTCDEAIEVKLAFKEADGTWNCFNPKVLQPGDTIVGYACKSEKGQYLKWTRKAGDNSIGFPTDKEINDQYKD